MKLEDRAIATLAAIPLEVERIHLSLAAGLAEYANAVRVTGSRVVSLPGLPAAGTTGLLWGGRCRVAGWSIRAVGGAAVLTLRDGRDVSSPVVAAPTIGGDGQSTTAWFGPAGLTIGDALSFDATVAGGGTLVGAVYLAAIDV
jgi:hypothetical protein